MKVLIYEQKELFDEFKELNNKLRCHQGIVQNNMVIAHKDSVVWINDLDETLEELHQWRNKILETLHCNLISDNKGSGYERELANNQGKIPSIEDS